MICKVILLNLKKSEIGAVVAMGFRPDFLPLNAIISGPNYDQNIEGT